jgi:hypothetical protein
MLFGIRWDVPRTLALESVAAVVREQAMPVQWDCMMDNQHLVWSSPADDMLDVFHIGVSAAKECQGSGFLSVNIDCCCCCCNTSGKLAGALRPTPGKHQADANACEVVLQQCSQAFIFGSSLLGTCSCAQCVACFNATHLGIRAELAPHWSWSRHRQFQAQRPLCATSGRRPPLHAMCTSYYQLVHHALTATMHMLFCQCGSIDRSSAAALLSYLAA